MARRFKFYLFGFSLGIILVIALYSNKSDLITAWTPEKRVLKRMRLTKKIISDSMQCILDCYRVNDSDWDYLYLNGDVYFGQARTKPYPIYKIEIIKDSIPCDFTFLAKDTLSILIDFKCIIPQKCRCE